MFTLHYATEPTVLVTGGCGFIGINLARLKLKMLISMHLLAGCRKIGIVYITHLMSGISEKT